MEHLFDSTWIEGDNYESNINLSFYSYKNLLQYRLCNTYYRE